MKKNFELSLYLLALLAIFLCMMMPIAQKRGWQFALYEFSMMCVATAIFGLLLYVFLIKLEKKRAKQQTPK